MLRFFDRILCDQKRLHVLYKDEKHYVICMIHEKRRCLSIVVLFDYEKLAIEANSKLFFYIFKILIWFGEFTKNETKIKWEEF